jgi:hypothetical protein
MAQFANAHRDQKRTSEVKAEDIIREVFDGKSERESKRDRDRIEVPKEQWGTVVRAAWGL